MHAPTANLGFAPFVLGKDEVFSVAVDSGVLTGFFIFALSASAADAKSFSNCSYSFCG